MLVRKIGEGAYGEVYEALDTWLDHPRALKLLKPEVSGRGTWRRVVLGPYATASEAEDIAAAVRASGLSDKAQTMRLKP